MRLSITVEADPQHGSCVRVLVDSLPAYPPEIACAHQDYMNHYRSIEFYMLNVTEGKHTIEAQWRTDSPTGICATDEKSLIAVAIPAQ